MNSAALCDGSPICDCWRSKFALTALASSGVPSWNVTPWRRWNVQTLPSALVSQLSARAGLMRVVAPSKVTRPSKICSVTRADRPSSMSAGSSFTASPDCANTSVRDDCAPACIAGANSAAASSSAGAKPRSAPRIGMRIDNLLEQNSQDRQNPGDEIRGRPVAAHDRGRITTRAKLRCNAQIGSGARPSHVAAALDAAGDQVPPGRAACCPPARRTPTGRTLGRVDEPATCPACGASVWTADGAMPGQQLRQAPGHPGGGMPMARVVTLVGGLGLLAAYFMPWFGSQGIMLTGAFLNQFLGTTPDLRRLVPGAVGGPLEVQLLRALVDFFPVAGGLGVVATLLVTLRPAWRADRKST